MTRLDAVAAFDKSFDVEARSGLSGLDNGRAVAPSDELRSMLVLKSLSRPRRPLVDPVVGLAAGLRDDDVFKFARLEVFSPRKAERNFSLLNPDDSVPTDGVWTDCHLRTF